MINILSPEELKDAPNAFIWSDDFHAAPEAGKLALGAFARMFYAYTGTKAESASFSDAARLSRHLATFSPEQLENIQVSGQQLTSLQEFLKTRFGEYIEVEPIESETIIEPAKPLVVAWAEPFIAPTTVYSQPERALELVTS